MLGRADLADGEVTACANCRAVLGRLRLTLEQLRREVAGELDGELGDEAA